MTKYDSHSKRHRVGILLSITGIMLNLLLFGLKYGGGKLSGSIAITADGFNNLADTGSCFLTLTGFLLSCKKPDNTYPMGYGRWEYLSGLLIAALILMIGGRMLLSSIDRILHPEPFDSSAAVLIILVISILIKGIMFLYNRRFGKILHSPAMRAAALDSLSDCLATLAILTACVIERFSGIHADGYTGILVAGCIIYAGITSVKENVEPLLGKGLDEKTYNKLLQIVKNYPQISRINMPILHDYGPHQKLISFSIKTDAPHKVIPSLEHDITEQLHIKSLISPLYIKNTSAENNALQMCPKYNRTKQTQEREANEHQTR